MSDEKIYLKCALTNGRLTDIMQTVQYMCV